MQPDEQRIAATPHDAALDALGIDREEHAEGVKKLVERNERLAASLYVCAECLNVLDQDETACAMACPDHPDAMRLWIEVPVSKEVIREVVEREYGVTA